LLFKKSYLASLQNNELNIALIYSIIGINLCLFCYKTKLNPGYQDIKKYYNNFIKLFNILNGIIIHKLVDIKIQEERVNIVSNSLKNLVCDDVINYVLIGYV
jgi:hypothetical protein